MGVSTNSLAKSGFNIVGSECLLLFRNVSQMHISVLMADRTPIGRLGHLYRDSSIRVSQEVNTGSGCMYGFCQI